MKKNTRSMKSRMRILRLLVRAIAWWLEKQTEEGRGRCTAMCISSRGLALFYKEFGRVAEVVVIES